MIQLLKINIPINFRGVYFHHHQGCVHFAASLERWIATTTTKLGRLIPNSIKRIERPVYHARRAGTYFTSVVSAIFSKIRRNNTTSWSLSIECFQSVSSKETLDAKLLHYLEVTRKFPVIISTLSIKISNREFCILSNKKAKDWRYNNCYPIAVFLSSALYILVQKFKFENQC